MLTIRLTRKGKKNQPFFRVVLVDKRRSSTGGRTVEDLGYVDPLKKRRSLKAERIKYWLSKGAKASGTIHNLLVTEKIIDEKKIVKKSKPAKSAVTAAQSGGPATIPPAADLGGKPAEPAPVEAPKEPASAESSGEAKELAPVEELKDLPQPAEPSSAKATEGQEEPKPVESPPAA